MNEYRGETAIQLGGRVYTIRLTHNVLAHLEREMDARGWLPSILCKGGYDNVAAVLHAALTVSPRDRVPPQIEPSKLSLAATSDAIDDAGGITANDAPISIAYYSLLANAGFADRETLQEMGLLPLPKKEDGPAEEVMAAIFLPESEAVGTN